MYACACAFSVVLGRACMRIVKARKKKLRRLSQVHCVLRLLQFGRTRCVCVLARNILAPVYLGFVCFVREQMILLCGCSFTCVSVEKNEWLGTSLFYFECAFVSSANNRMEKCM